MNVGSLLRPLAAGLGLACTLAAQGPVVPSRYATLEGGARTNFPLGLGGPCRAQHVYGRTLFMAPFTTVNVLALRGDGGQNVPAKGPVQLSVAMSTSVADPRALSIQFANNRGTDHRVVFGPTSLSLPALTAGTQPPEPFAVFLPLAQPFAYARALGHLLVEFEVAAQPNAAYPLDATIAVPPFHGSTGTPCQGLTQTVHNGSASPPNQGIGWSIAGAIPGGSAGHLLGIQAFTPPLPLPFGGCPLHQDVVLATVVPVSAAGTARLDYPLVPVLQGNFVRSQWIAIDAALTRMTSSESIRTVFGGNEDVGRVYNLQSLSDPLGTVQAGVVPVVRLD